MNRKIFTMLACALMLFSTAFYANARTVADKSVGALVTSLPSKSDGMYHILVDSIYWTTDGNPASAKWYPVTWDGDPKGLGNTQDYIQYNPTTGGFTHRLADEIINSGGNGDTIVLSITESGKVRLICINDLNDRMGEDNANLADLQATMWCINIQQEQSLGQQPVFHFKNRIFGEDLDWMQTGITHVSGTGKGWMYSMGWNGNPELGNKLPLYRSIEGNNAQYTVIKANNDLITWAPTFGFDPEGLLLTADVTRSNFVNMNATGIEELIGLLKVSIVKVSPFVLTAYDFNSMFGLKDGNGRVQLFFNKSTTIFNEFVGNSGSNVSPGNSPANASYRWLRAEDPSDNTSAPYRLNYLKIQAFSAATGGTPYGYIYNEKGNYNTDDPSDKYLNIMTSPSVKEDDDDFNLFYRFVYFPSEDSVIINAFEVEHDNHGTHSSLRYWDQHPATLYEYQPDPGAPYFYGLFNTYMYNSLIVRWQDISGGTGTQSMITIDNALMNVKISFGENTCKDMYTDGWLVPKGLYTIWDDRGRALGVRIYNGSYTPQWLELLPGECPDRIPSYQWIVEQSEYAQGRVTITNREFGDMPLPEPSVVRMENVFVTRHPSTIFLNQGQFQYSDIAMAAIAAGYEPIIWGLVTGQLLAPILPDECNIKSAQSGFRPVTREYANDPYLGYKHFQVNKTQGTVAFGKSEDIGSEKGMDYNAFAFNYYHQYNDENYINLRERYNSQLLYVEESKLTGFQFLLGENLRRLKLYNEEDYGYPAFDHPDYPNKNGRNAATVDADPNDWFVEIKDAATIGTAPNTMPNPGYLGPYTQDIVSLQRYYYELKIADFYTYRDSLAEQYVILNGAKNDNTDRENRKLYGVFDVSANREPFKFANLYLRETYFIEKPIKDPLYGYHEEMRHELDPTRRIYYALLDRIPESERHKLTEMGLEVTDTLFDKDGTKYNLVVLAVQDFPAWIVAQGKTMSSTRVSTFALENLEFELYRRLRSIEDDWREEDLEEQDFSTMYVYDAPKILRIHRVLNTNEFLHEDAISDIDYGKGINFLGLANATYHKEQLALDNTVKYNFNLYIDTAYINRGTGPIKPQYLIAVGVDTVLWKQWTETTTTGNVCLPGSETETFTIYPYIRGRYLVNATDSARGPGSNGSSPIIHPNYAMPANNDRLVFVDAIHAYDRLYIVSSLKKANIDVDKAPYTVTDDCGKTYLKVDLIKAAVENTSLTLPAGYVRERVPGVTDVLALYYDFGHWDNYHNDVTFSLRFTHGYAKNPGIDGKGGSDNFTKRFYIESETTQRTVSGNRKIAPTQGGWIRLHNDNIPVLSRGSYEQAIGQADMFNVQKRSDWQNGVPTGNDAVEAKFSVVGGIGELTLLNVSGKQVTVTNMLGQTVATVIPASDNETVKVSKGVVIVSVAGESAVKTIVK